MPELTIDQALQQAVVYHQAGQFADAEMMYQHILVYQPNHPDALHLLGVLASQTGRHELACELISRAIDGVPNHPNYHRNLGTAQRHLGLLDEAIASWDKALQLKPNMPDLLNSLGTARQEKGQLSEALVCFRRSISMAPNDADAHYNLARAMEDKGDLDQAIAGYQHALHLKPSYPQAWNNLAKIYRDRGQMEDSIAAYRKAIQIDPNFLVAHQNLLFAMQYLPGCTNEQLASELSAWNRQFAEPLAAAIQRHPNDRDAHRRLRIGYVSPDFRSHVVARFYILNLLEHRNRDAFEIFCYAQVPKPDEMTTRLQALADHWRSTVGLTDEQIAGKVREDRIDILVDLALHTAGNRLLVFARKPAPVQITAAGYPGSTGLPTIDCRLTDPFLDPVGLGVENYVERSARMPDTFWCDPQMERQPEVNDLPAITNGYVTFGSLNNFCKTNDELLGRWAAVMNQVVQSRLILLAPAGQPRERVLRVMSGQGVDTDRIEFVGMQKRADYLATYHRIDIGLDTFPFNGHSTSVDSFWMGVPVVTQAGATEVGRAGVSQLMNLQLGELIGQTAEQYIKIAVDLAGDLPRLANLRSNLRQRMQKSPLMDASRFVRRIEAIYRQEWRRWCDKPHPQVNTTATVM